MRITKFGHIEHIYYGQRLGDLQDVEPLAVKRTAQKGSTIAYDRSDPLYSLDAICLEWSGIGKGDYRFSPAEMKMQGGFVSDFIYESHRIFDGCIPIETLPSAYGNKTGCRSLELILRDSAGGALLKLYYTVFFKTNVITRRAVLENTGDEAIVIRRLLSMSLDMPNTGCKLVTFDGDWIKEANRHDRTLQYGMFVNSSVSGASGNKHNPGFLLAEETATEEQGRVYGFNLVYSGNHFGFAELSSHDLVRVGIGINPHCFEWILEKGGRFETPEAVMTFSGGGFNGLSRNFHDFVNAHIVRGEWKDRERPILFNSWEACFFKFTRGKLLRLARQAKKLGAELFVLDDGWFKGRDSDSAGLGDYAPNRRKFPKGLAPFAEKIRALGLDFGLWFEPEMVNEDSDLFRNHPEYAVRMPGREPTLGRNQLVLDLCNSAVRDYIVESVGAVLDETGAAYVKWDMNRHISEFWSDFIGNQGEFFHRYILGLYEILGRIFVPRPHILLESCSSGGNRFDLGMLCFSPQIWASDNTDPWSRLGIQGGLSYLYPLSAIGAHVSDAPHQQTLRLTPLSTRFNAACFGCIGYEMDLRYLTPAEKREIKGQIAFYKAHRRTFQFGEFSRVMQFKDNKTVWQCREKDGSKAVSGFFQGAAGVSEGPDLLRVTGLDAAALYRVSAKAQSFYIRRIGGLVKHVLPVSLDPDGLILRTVNRHYALNDCAETYICGGDVLEAGIFLNNQFMGTYYNDKTRLLGDFGSNLYLTLREG